MSKIFEYDPVIWPRLLWVVVGEDINFLQSNFESIDGTAYGMDKNDVDASYALCCTEICKKDTGKIGELVWLHTPQKVNESLIAHESLHACNAMLLAAGVRLSQDNDEAQAYTLQFCYEKVSKAFSESKS